MEDLKEFPHINVINRYKQFDITVNELDMLLKDNYVTDGRDRFKLSDLKNIEFFSITGNYDDVKFLAGGKEVNTDAFDKVNCEVLEKLLSMMPNLKVLTLYGFKLDGKEFNCPVLDKLEELDVSHLYRSAIYCKSIC
jgi:hypothetical protein